MCSCLRPTVNVDRAFDSVYAALAWIEFTAQVLNVTREKFASVLSGPTASALLYPSQRFSMAMDRLPRPTSEAGTLGLDRPFSSAIAIDKVGSAGFVEHH